MIGFYKRHIDKIVEQSVDPDRRRYAVEYEAARHYIDIDHYGDSALYSMPRNWEEAIQKYSEDTLQAYGIVPWHISFMKFQLTKAFEDKNSHQIIKLSSEIGHYIADANVPLHTTENYNGQLTDQHGIHGFWESRLPELFSSDYDLLVGQADYIESPQNVAWSAITHAHLAVDYVLTLELKLTNEFEGGKKYSYEARGSSTTRVYSNDFSTQYNRHLNGMVERRMKAAIKMVASFWYTSWVDAGQPDLILLSDSLVQRDKKNWLRVFKSRPHEN